MRRHKRALCILLLGLAATSDVFSLSHSPQGRAASPQIYENLELFGEVLELVRSNYVEKPDDAALVENAINGMLAGLDPHSRYLTTDEVEEEQAHIRGEFGGLGLEVTLEEGVLKVVGVIDNTPAERAGVLAGDSLIAVNDESLEGLSLKQAERKLRGPLGARLTLTIERKGAAKPITLTTVRDIIRIDPVAYRIEGDIGWIKIKTFENEHTFRALKDAVEGVKETLGPRLAGYVIDLRNNPGGLLDEAVAVADAFLGRGTIVITKGRRTSDIDRARAKHDDITGGKPLVVLINGGSASAAEIVAGALQDHKRAQVIGTRSFGKGSVQTIISLGGKGALILTTARYYTLSGRSIQATGIEPDYVVEPDLPADLKRQLPLLSPHSEASLPRHLSAAESERDGSLAYVPKEKDKDNQLAAAIDFLHGTPPAPIEKNGSSRE